MGGVGGGGAGVRTGYTGGNGPFRPVPIPRGSRIILRAGGGEGI